MPSDHVPPPLQSAGRRRPKNLPSLPMSAFSPPNTGTSDMFPMPPTPSAVFPDAIVDAHAAPATLAELRPGGASQLLADKVKGVVLRLDDEDAGAVDVDSALSGLQTDVPVLSVLVPFALNAPPPSDAIRAGKYPTTLYTTFDPSRLAPGADADKSAAQTLRWALESGRVVDIDVRGDVMANEAADRFVALLTNATASAEMQARPPTIVLSNVCPPPHDLALPIVKLMNHPAYHAYQAQTATLSLFPRLHIKFTPPMWGALPPARGSAPAPADADAYADADVDAALEWKRRIKMYIGPVLEAFGYERILFGSAPSPANTAGTGTGDKASLADWYALVRESFAELAIDQDAIDAIFAENARRVYGSAGAAEAS